MVYKSLIRSFDYFIRLLSLQLLHWETDLPVLWQRFNSTLTTNEFHNILISDGSPTYIDKSGFIEEYLESVTNSSLLLISRPRKWGKTINLHMLKSFLEIELNSDTGDPIPESDRINRKLFYGGVIRSTTSGQTRHLKPLKIAKSHKTSLSLLQGTFPVLYIDLKCIAGDSYRQIEYNLKQYLMFLFDRYRYLNSSADSDQDKLLFQYCQRGTNRLSRLLRCLPLLTGLMNKRYRRKVYLLLDDYDAPQNRLLYRLLSDGDDEITVKLDDVLNSSSFTKSTSLLSRLFVQLFCGNDALHRSLMTGLFPVGTFQMRSDLRDVLHTCTVLDLEYSDYFGFRELEVRQLLQQFSLSHKVDEVRAWYGGFNVGETEYFHPYCVVKYMEKTGAYYDRKINVVPGIDFLDYLLSSDKYQSEVRDLAIDGTITSDKFDARFTTFIEFAEGNFYPYLISAGYLSPAFTVRTDLKMDFRVPNEQAKEVYRERIIDWRRRVFPLLLSDEVRHYMLLLMRNKFPEFEQWLKTVFDSMEHLDKQKVSKGDPISIRVSEEMYYSCCVYFLALEISDCHDVIVGQDSDPTKEDRTDIEIVPRKRTGYHNVGDF